MPSVPFFIDPFSPCLAKDLASIKRTPGVCIFIDIVGSTKMKQLKVGEWIAKTYNVFENAKSVLNPFEPIKFIGDEMMFFIEDEDMLQRQVSLLGLTDSIVQIASYSSSILPEVKITAAHCNSVYPVSFSQGMLDYYGYDIDRAARLKTVVSDVQGRVVVIDDSLYWSIMMNDCKSQFSYVDKFKGPCIYEAKGLVLPIVIYRAEF